ncbi:MAG TPA: hypothetical protein VI911_11310 [Patescibacteria group bacterium]|nr:hypothetical protein [Patescibacteria group bacterium]
MRQRDIHLEALEMLREKIQKEYEEISKIANDDPVSELGNLYREFNTMTTGDKMVNIDKMVKKERELNARMEKQKNLSELLTKQSDLRFKLDKIIGEINNIEYMAKLYEKQTSPTK